MITPKLRLGAVGLGRAFSLMRPTFMRHPRVALVAGADPRAEARVAFTRDFNGNAYATIEELCDDPHVGAVYISTPHELHAAQACYAAARGKHLLIEKPIALTLADCTSILDAARKAGVALVVGHSHSFDAPIARTRALIESGRYGALRMIHTLNYTDWLYRPRRPEELGDGGGVIFNQAPHQVDVVRLLVGGKATSVRANAGAWDPNRPVPVAYSALLNFESGAFASMTYSGFAHFDSDVLMNWIGEGGQTKNSDAYGGARWSLARITTTADEQILKSSRAYGGNDFNEPRASPATPLQHPHFGFLVATCDGADFRPMPDGVMIFDNEKSWFDPLPPPDLPRGEVIDELIAAIGGKPPLHGGEWSRATIEVCLAMQESARSQREIPLKFQVGL